MPTGIITHTLIRYNKYTVTPGTQTKILVTPLQHYTRKSVDQTAERAIDVLGLLDCRSSIKNSY